MERFAWLKWERDHHQGCCCFACIIGDPELKADARSVPQPSREFVRRIAPHGAFLREVEVVSDAFVSTKCRRVMLSCGHNIAVTTLDDGTPCKRYYLCVTCQASAANGRGSRRPP